MFSIHASWASARVERYESPDLQAVAEHCLHLLLGGYVIHRVVTSSGRTVNGAHLDVIFRGAAVRSPGGPEALDCIRRFSDCLQLADR